MKVKKSTNARGRLRVHGSFVLGYVIRELGHVPTARQLSAFTRANPAMFPEPGWTEEQAQRVLDHPDVLLTPSDETGEQCASCAGAGFFLLGGGRDPQQCKDCSGTGRQP